MSVPVGFPPPVTTQDGAHGPAVGPAHAGDVEESSSGLARREWRWAPRLQLDAVPVLDQWGRDRPARVDVLDGDADGRALLRVRGSSNRA